MNTLQEFINFLVTSDKEFELVDNKTIYSIYTYPKYESGKTVILKEDYDDALLRRKEIHFIFNEDGNLLTWKVR